MKGIPDFDREIELTCSDFRGEYKIKGMFIKYKKPTNQQKRIGGRFCTLEDGKWESNSSEWSQRESWEYVEEEIENFGEEGICTKCKEHTTIGDSCCGDEYVHIN